MRQTGVGMLIFRDESFLFRGECSTLTGAGDPTPPIRRDAVFGLGKKKPTKGTSDSKTDRYNEQKDDEATWSFLGSAKEESDRKAKRGD